MDSRIQHILEDQQQLEMNRANWDSHWQEIAERILPRQNDFNQTRSEGEKRTEKIFDSTAVLALDRFASAVDSLITPATQVWHRMVPEDSSLLESKPVMVFMDELTKQLFRMRYRPAANFASQAHECYISSGAFGTMNMFVDDVVGVGTRYKSIPMVETYIAENHAGVVDLVHRKFQLTAKQAVQAFGDKLGDKIKKAYEKNKFQKFDFVHCVKPNMDIKPRNKTFRGMAFSSYYVSVDEQIMLDEGGYRVMPYAVSRYATSPRETYGRSPAMAVLADIKMLNEMEKTMLRAAHKQVSPPLLAYGDGVLASFKSRPDAVNYGTVDERGNPLVHALQTGARLPIGMEMSEQRRRVINDSFLVTLFQILVQNPQMTATEAMLRAQEKGQLLAPTMGRQQSEFLGPIIAREIDILTAAGALPPMPPELADTGGAIRVEYTSPLSRLRRADDAVAIMRTIEQLSPIGEADPTVWDIFDKDATARELAEINGAPAKIFNSPEQMAALREKREKQAMERQMLEAAATASGAAKDLSAAQAQGGFSPLALPQ